MSFRSALRTVLLCVVLMAALFPMQPARAATTIELLNPSGYTATSQLSGKQDSDATYHLVAWVGEVPANPLVEFEIIGVQSPTTTATLTATPVGGDTFEADFAIPASFVDGQYLLRAIIYENFTGPGTGTERDTVEQVVTLNNQDEIPPPQAETVEMNYPENGDEFGFFTAPGGRHAGVVTGLASGLARQVRVLYATSGPGTAPNWTGCGSGPVATDRSFRARCLLAEGTSPGSVRAIAAVANETAPPVPPNEATDEAGDAHRVVPYVSDPAIVAFEPSAVQQDPANCIALTAEVADQNGNPIVGANIDVHAVGPDDQLRFADQRDVSSAFQAPDKAHGGTEQTTKCAATDEDATQAEHSVPGGNDIKHIESTTGTTTASRFTFVLKSDAVGPTQVSAWVDENDDDTRGIGETSGGARIGWGQAPPPPEQEVFVDPGSVTATVGTCQRLVAVARQGGTPIVGANADVHIGGPDGVAFCSTGDSTTRAPDAGGHTGDAHDGDTRHNEGETNGDGQIIFGVTAPSDGSTDITVWLDTTEDDAQGSGEATGPARVSWQRVGDRSVSIRSSARRVRKGRRVRISGTITAAASCADDQVVRLQARRPRRSFKNIGTTRSDEDGDYQFRVRVRKTKDYRALVPRNGVCDRARSRAVRVRARR